MHLGRATTRSKVREGTSSSVSTLYFAEQVTRQLDRWSKLADLRKIRFMRIANASRTGIVIVVKRTLNPA